MRRIGAVNVVLEPADPVDVVTVHDNCYLRIGDIQLRTGLNVGRTADLTVLRDLARRALVACEEKLALERDTARAEQIARAHSNRRFLQDVEAQP